MLPHNGRTVRFGYVRRLMKPRQMDFEYSVWQMATVCVNPSKLYRSTTWHKQTKNQWARDDPAFFALLLVFCLSSALATACALQLSVGHAVAFVLSSVLLHFLLLGAVVASVAWSLANRFLRVRGGVHTHSLEQSVEWMYAFDVHCNAFFPMFVLLHVVQFLIWPLLLTEGSFVALLASNALYLVAHGFYWHVTFLGYNALPFLQQTVVFVYPVAVAIVLFFITVAGGINVSRLSLDVSLALVGAGQ